MEIFDAVQKGAYYLIYIICGVIGFFLKKVFNKQDELDADMNETKTKLAVLSIQIVDAKDDIRDIKNSINALECSVSSNIQLLRDDIKTLMRERK